MAKAQIFTPLPEGDSDAPEWVSLMPVGLVRMRDGRAPFHLDDAEKVIAASFDGPRIPVDENHSTELAAKAGFSARAVGRVLAMRVQGGYLQGQISWNKVGRELVAEKAYGGISPVFETGPGRVVTKITSIALTNDPAINLPHLNSRQNQGTDMELSELARRLGLSEAATQADVDRALLAAREGRVLCAAVAQTIGVDEAVATPLLIEGLRKKLDDAQSAVKAAKDEAAQGRVLASMQAAAGRGVEISEALRDSLLAVAKLQPESAIAMVEALPVSGVAGKHLAHRAANGADRQENGQTDAQKIASDLAGVFGNDPKAVVAAMGGINGSVI